MIVRALVGPVMAAAFAVAPLQCPHDTDAAHCWDDAPGDSLWDLAQKFRDNHDDAAARRTLQFLVERYPASRFAPAARQELGLEADASPVARDP